MLPLQERIDALNQEIRDTRIRHAEQLALLETSTMRKLVHP